jgi:predicted nucleic acid-binding protein
LSAYLDASVIIPALVREPGSAAVDAFMSELDEELVVSEFAAAEVASALSRLARIGVIALEEAGRRLADFDAWRASSTVDMDLRAADARMANVIVRRFDLGLRAPDALHAAMCRRENHLLVTLDKRLASAAPDLGVRIRLLM